MVHVVFGDRGHHRITLASISTKVATLLVEPPSAGTCICGMDVCGMEGN